jgi:hypothetical protein
MYAFITIGCNSESIGFALPEGDIALGKQSFVQLSCNQCHSVSDIVWKGDPNTGDVHVKLGGDVSNIKTYGELVTSVINPSHKIAKVHAQETTTPEGKSKMRLYNEVMTVQDLIDIVSFLKSEYAVTPPPFTYQ